MHRYPDTIPYGVDRLQMDITGYVASLLEGTEGLQIKYESMVNKEYIKIDE
jgi:hypothetical protein